VVFKGRLKYSVFKIAPNDNMRQTIMLSVTVSRVEQKFTREGLVQSKTENCSNYI